MRILIGYQYLSKNEVFVLPRKHLTREMVRADEKLSGLNKDFFFNPRLLSEFAIVIVKEDTFLKFLHKS